MGGAALAGQPGHAARAPRSAPRWQRPRARTAAGVGDQDVLRLEVAVDDARVAQHAQRVQHLAQQPLQQAQRQPPEAVALQQLKQVGPQPLEHQAQVVAVFCWRRVRERGADGWAGVGEGEGR